MGQRSASLSGAESVVDPGSSGGEPHDPSSSSSSSRAPVRLASFKACCFKCVRKPSDVGDTSGDVPQVGRDRSTRSVGAVSSAGEVNWEEVHQELLQHLQPQKADDLLTALFEKMENRDRARSTDAVSPRRSRHLSGSSSRGGPSRGELGTLDESAWADDLGEFDSDEAELAALDDPLTPEDEGRFRHRRERSHDDSIATSGLLDMMDPKSEGAGSSGSLLDLPKVLREASVSEDAGGFLEAPVPPPEDRVSVTYSTPAVVDKAAEAEALGSREASTSPSRQVAQAASAEGPPAMSRQTSTAVSASATPRPAAASQTPRLSAASAQPAASQPTPSSSQTPRLSPATASAQPTAPVTTVASQRLAALLVQPPAPAPSPMSYPAVPLPQPATPSPRPAAASPLPPLASASPQPSAASQPATSQTPRLAAASAQPSASHLARSPQTPCLAVATPASMAPTSSLPLPKASQPVPTPSLAASTAPATPKAAAQTPRLAAASTAPVVSLPVPSSSQTPRLAAAAAQSAASVQTPQLASASVHQPSQAARPTSASAQSAVPQTPQRAASAKQPATLAGSQAEKVTLSQPLALQPRLTPSPVLAAATSSFPPPLPAATPRAGPVHSPSPAATPRLEPASAATVAKERPRTPQPDAPPAVGDSLPPDHKGSDAGSVLGATAESIGLVMTADGSTGGSTCLETSISAQARRGGSPQPSAEEIRRAAGVLQDAFRSWTAKKKESPDSLESAKMDGIASDRANVAMKTPEVSTARGADYTPATPLSAVPPLPNRSGPRMAFPSPEAAGSALREDGSTGGSSNPALAGGGQDCFEPHVHFASMDSVIMLTSMDSQLSLPQACSALVEGADPIGSGCITLDVGDWEQRNKEPRPRAASLPACAARELAEPSSDESSEVTDDMRSQTDFPVPRSHRRNFSIDREVELMSVDAPSVASASSPLPAMSTLASASSPFYLGNVDACARLVSSIGRGRSFDGEQGKRGSKTLVTPTTQPSAESTPLEAKKGLRQRAQSSWSAMHFRKEVAEFEAQAAATSSAPRAHKISRLIRWAKPKKSITTEGAEDAASGETMAASGTGGAGSPDAAGSAAAVVRAGSGSCGDFRGGGGSGSAGGDPLSPGSPRPRGGSSGGDPPSPGAALEVVGTMDPEAADDVSVTTSNVESAEEEIRAAEAAAAESAAAEIALMEAAVAQAAVGANAAAVQRAVDAVQAADGDRDQLGSVTMDSFVHRTLDVSSTGSTGEAEEGCAGSAPEGRHQHCGRSEANKNEDEDSSSDGAQRGTSAKEARSRRRGGLSSTRHRKLASPKPGSPKTGSPRKSRRSRRSLLLLRVNGKEVARALADVSPGSPRGSDAGSDKNGSLGQSCGSSPELLSLRSAAPAAPPLDLAKAVRAAAPAAESAVAVPPRTAPQGQQKEMMEQLALSQAMWQPPAPPKKRPSPPTLSPLQEDFQEELTRSPLSQADSPLELPSSPPVQRQASPPPELRKADPVPVFGLGHIRLAVPPRRGAAQLARSLSLLRRGASPIRLVAALARRGASPTRSVMALGRRGSSSPPQLHVVTTAASRGASPPPPPRPASAPRRGASPQWRSPSASRRGASPVIRPPRTARPGPPLGARSRNTAAKRRAGTEPCVQSVPVFHADLRPSLKYAIQRAAPTPQEQAPSRPPASGWRSPLAAASAPAPAPAAQVPAWATWVRQEPRPPPEDLTTEFFQDAWDLVHIMRGDVHCVSCVRDAYGR